MESFRFFFGWCNKSQLFQQATQRHTKSEREQEREAEHSRGKESGTCKFIGSWSI